MHFSDSCQNYYDFEEENLLFVNVESDFSRIAPLIEAALYYSQNHKVYFLDISRSHIEGIFPRINKLTYDFFRGGNLVTECRKYLVSRNINIIELETFSLAGSNKGFTFQEELSLKLAIRNQNIDSITNCADAQDMFEKKRNRYLTLKRNLEAIFPKYSIQRLFVWNGRFEMSTVVAIAGESQNVRVTKVEWGSLINNSLEIFREPPRNRYDAWNRAHQFQRELKNGIRSLPEHDDLNLFVNDWKVNRFTSRFNNESQLFDLELKQYVVFYTSSFWESATYGQYVYEVDQNEIESAKVIIDVANEFGLLVVIRVHPNPWSPNYEQFESSLWQNALLECHTNNFILVEASSNFDSYVLAEKSLAVFTVASTIGYECIARGIPTFFISDSAWESRMQSNKYTYDRDKIRNFLKSPNVISLEPFRYLLLYKKHYGFRFNFLSKTHEGKVFFSNTFLMNEKDEYGILFALLSKVKHRLLERFRFLTKYQVP